MIYLITYDLRKPGQSYPALIEEIKRISSEWAKPCESTWVIKTNLTTEQVVDQLKAIDATDRLLVTTVSTPWWSMGLDPKVVVWLKSNL